jgi:hypothetical protein
MAEIIDLNAVRRARAWAVPDQPELIRLIEREAAQAAIGAYRDALAAQRRGDRAGARLLTEVAERLAGLGREATAPRR